jgi:putative FmdB family regulatory protein
MPLFDFRCGTCGERFESLRTRADEPAPHCPRCGATGAERLLSAFSVTHATSSGRGAGPCGSSECGCMRRMADG